MNLLDNLGYVRRESVGILKKKTSNLPLIADLIRFNTLLSVARAGTGHLGASLSIVELLTEIYFRSFKFDPQNKDIKNRDIFILSKGHAVPSLYSTLAFAGYFEISNLDKLRRLGGLQGHADIATPGIEANTGSLAMGLSKGVGYALAKKRFKQQGNVIVIVGDGELQEGQCWEALLSAAGFKLDNLYIVIDDNRVQTDQFTKNIVNYGDLKGALINLGFQVIEGSGRNINEISKVFKQLKIYNNKPKIFYANTIKGQGISYMEHTNVLKTSSDRYVWHNKAPNSKLLKQAFLEILARNQKHLRISGFTWNLELSLKKIPRESMQSGINGDKLTESFANVLIKQAEKNSKIVVFDGDLEEDCGFIPFHNLYPDRFLEMGIMEQHIVSSACAFARSGYLPVIATYAAFLSSRANEQLYNLATEKVKALIIGNMSGIIPATPGKSHQAFRDIACLKNIPGIIMYQPVSGDDIENILKKFFRSELGDLLYLRLSMASSRETLPAHQKGLKKGTTQLIRKGKDAILVGIGPVILGEALKAAEILSGQKISLEVRNNPWIIDFDRKDFEKLAARNLPLIIVEDHFKKGGFGESLLSFLQLNSINFSKIKHLALNDFPETGFRSEILNKFNLDSSSISASVRHMLK